MMRKSAALLLALAMLAPCSTAVKWKLFRGSIECVQAHIPDTQWDMVLDSLASTLPPVAPPPSLTNPQPPTHSINETFVRTATQIDLAWMAHSGGAALDAILYDGQGSLLYRESGSVSDQLSLHLPAGSRGPYRLCLGVSDKSRVHRPSVLVELTYFDVNVHALRGTEYETIASKRKVMNGTTTAPPTKSLAGAGAAAAAAVPMRQEQGPTQWKSMTTLDQEQEAEQELMTMERSLFSLSHQLAYVRHRHAMHMDTLRKTHRRTLAASVLVSLAAVMTSLFQVHFIRRLFSVTHHSSFRV